MITIDVTLRQAPPSSTAPTAIIGGWNTLAISPSAMFASGASTGVAAIQTALRALGNWRNIRCR